ncbi:hypothetical protein BASA61_004053 [Batrachochytrium salamandrivorans]|nr:hypothetical protein BASA61_004053 [Batrachochytrium salamandrivorans]
MLKLKGNVNASCLAASSSRGRSSVIRGEPVNDVVKYLLPKTDVRMLAGSHFSLLAQHDVEVTLYLIKCGASLEQRDASGSTALHLAARAGKLDQIIALVLGRIDVNLTGQKRLVCASTALHEAVGLYRKDVVQYLLKKGADRNARTSTGETPIDIARRLGFSADELEIYFERQIDDAFFKRKEDSIASMSKLIQVVNDVRSGGSGGSHSMYMSGVNGNGSGGSHLLTAVESVTSRHPRAVVQQKEAIYGRLKKYKKDLEKI